MRTLRARLLLDSALMDREVGARSALSSDRTLLFRADDLTVDVMLHVGAQPPGYLHGQVIRDGTGGRPVPDAEVSLLGETGDTRTDEHGQFSLSTPLPEGRNELRISVADTTIVCNIPGFEDEPGH